MNPKLAKGAAAVGAVAVLVFGAAAISGANSGSSSSAAATTSGAHGFGGAPGQLPQQGQNGRPPGFGTDVTGAKATLAAKAALAKYPGQVEHIEQLQDGSYVVHVIQSSGEVHVLVSTAFKVTGHQAGPGGVPGGQAPPAPSTSSSVGKTTKS